jgi:hypothetical protein
MHCHIAEHSDVGVIGVARLVGAGNSALSPPTVTDFGTCPADLPASTPYAAAATAAGGGRIAIPGVIEAEAYDDGGEGVAYHNYNIAIVSASSPGAAFRDGSAVETAHIGGGGAVAPVYVTGIRGGEWLRWSVTVAADGYYSVTMNVAAASDAAPTAGGMRWTL